MRRRMGKLTFCMGILASVDIPSLLSIFLYFIFVLVASPCMEGGHEHRQVHFGMSAKMFWDFLEGSFTWSSLVRST
jgi:hypothetical protein